MEGDKIEHFEVGEDCPYYAGGYTIAKVKYNTSEIIGVVGPGDEFYTSHQKFGIDFAYENNTCSVQQQPEAPTPAPVAVALPQKYELDTTYQMTVDSEPDRFMRHRGY
jgi:hypothetical protein